jgi:putative membrane protein
VADAGVLALVASTAVLYAAGVLRAWERAGTGRIVRPGQVACFGSGLVVVAIALASPLETAADTDLAAHMVQHVLLITVAAPLLVLGAPLIAFGIALEGHVTSRLAGARVHRRVRGPAWLAWTAFALGLHSIAVALWHLPAPYDAAATNPAVHALEHASFLGTAMLLWWTVLGSGRRTWRGAGVVVLFLATLPANALGLIMTLAAKPWYPHYAASRGATAALADQQLAGVVMWGFGGVATLVGAFALFVAWLHGLERATPGRSAERRPLGMEPS